MKAAFVVEPLKVQVKEVAEPVMKDDEVLIEVQTVGVCGSDLQLFHGTHPFRQPPAVLGHEIAGKIIKIGPKVTKFAVGDRVTVEPQIGCNHCEFCDQQLTNLCTGKIVPGTPAWSGTFVQYFNAPEHVLYKLADNVSYEKGTLTEPLAVAVHALNRVSVKSRDCIVVLGSGTVGLLCQVVAREMGFKTIIVTDTAPFNREMAMKYGATCAIDPLAEDAVAKVKELTGGRGADVTLICASAPTMLDQASQCTRKRGEIGIVAMITKPIPFYCYSIVFNEQNMFGCMTYETKDFVKAAEMINGGLELPEFVTHHFPAEQTQEALDTLAFKKGDVVKVIVDMQ